ncbi:AraC family transcriptional regulator [Paenibacillus rigui]|uniref:AraC family transcriptional regulator n=2 Tax=Paenibacillus rigui TaxID=554312 RepID=A0A229UJ74_9BACL|nr:bifunctional transcriptional activator/DNA repair enzyme AdaA [Paenibacillus rigui]OXM83423.1 AraC family transcriptional regulator [Paenibacillus rigui]
MTDLNHGNSETVPHTSTSAAKPMHAKAVMEEQWRAILNNDAAYDGQFFYAVKTTRIFCRPSCKSKPPKKEHVHIFHTAEQALSAGFRTCKRCKPSGTRMPDEEWIQLITQFIDNHYMEPLTLGKLAEISHGSPYHLHRIFKRVQSVTPIEYIQQRRIEKAKELLIQTDKFVTEVGQMIGLHNTPYFITIFKKNTGHTPAEYRQRNRSNDEEALSDE